MQRWNEYVKSSPYLRDVISVLKNINSRGYAAYIVGGAVRDIVLGKSFSDIDVATNMPMDKIEKLYKTHDIGRNKDFGIVVVNLHGNKIEIANFRSDGLYSDGRRPETVTFNVSLETDMARRDFQVNSMAIDKDGNLIDYFDGKSDIKNKVLKTVGNPLDRFTEDKLRIVRLARFASRLGFSIDKETLKAARKMGFSIKDLPAERIKDEIFKAAQRGDRLASFIEYLDKIKILKYILPELIQLKYLKHKKIHHPEGTSVWDHVRSALEQSNTKDPIVNLAILLHDIGKTVTYGQKDGYPTYFGHEDEAFNLINTIADRLKFSNAEREAILFAALNHMKFHKIKEMSKSKIMKLVNNKYFDVLVAVSYSDEASRLHHFSEKEFEDKLKFAIEVKKKYGMNSVTQGLKLVDGNHVMALTGLKPGKQLGDIIKKTTEWIVDNNLDPIKDSQKINNYIITLHKGI